MLPFQELEEAYKYAQQTMGNNLWEPTVALLSDTQKLVFQVT